jgi:hypothetical protein
MDQIPNELLSDVFSLLMSRVDQDPAFVRSLCQVCNRWRRVAIATGNLWCRINITLPLSKQQQKWTEIYLAHSNPYPLDIIIDLRDPEWDWNEESHTATGDAVVPIVRLLLQHSSRWRRFEMLTDNWAPIFAFLFYTKAKITAPLLEVLSLSRCNAYLAAQGQNFQPGHLAKPMSLLGGGESALDSLSTVTLVGVHIDWNYTVLKNLKRLEFKYHSRDVMPTPEQFRCILNSCPGLLNLSIVGWGPRLDDAATYPEGMFYLPALKELTFGFVDVGYAVKLFSLFHIPNLQSLVLEDINPFVTPVNVQNASQLLDWLAARPRTSPSIPPIRLSCLVHLELRCIRAEKQAFSNFLDQLVLLQHLTFFNMLDDTLDCLCSTGSGKDVYVCPKLTELHCMDVNPHALIRVACRRGRMSLESLQRMRIAFLNKHPVLESETFENLLRAGIEVVEGEQDK